MRRAPLVLVVAGCVSALATGLAGALTSAEYSGPRSFVATAMPPERSTSDNTTQASVRVTAPAARWAHVLGRLDARRAAAFAHGEPRLLRRVYAAGSATLAEDIDTLAAYKVRRLRLEVAMTLLEVRVARADRERVVLHVVDRLEVAAAVDRAGSRTTLPRDQPTAHVIALARTTDGWRITAVRDAKRS